MLAVLVTTQLIGCSSDEYRYRYTGGGGEWVQFVTPADMQTMIDTCHIEPSELVMADLKGDYLSKRLKNKTCKSIHDVLAKFHRNHDPEPMSMMNNPALLGSLPTITGIKYAAMSVSAWAGQGNQTGLSRVALVDVGKKSLVYGERCCVLSYPEFATRASLNSSMVDEFMSDLSPMLTWGLPWTDSVTDNMAVNKYLYSWTFAVIGADDKLYRWDGSVYCESCDHIHDPPGLLQVYDAFWSLVPE